MGFHLMRRDHGMVEMEGFAWRWQWLPVKGMAWRAHTLRANSRSPVAGARMIAGAHGRVHEIETGAGIGPAQAPEDEVDAGCRASTCSNGPSVMRASLALKRTVPPHSPRGAVVADMEL